MTLSSASQNVLRHSPLVRSRICGVAQIDHVVLYSGDSDATIQFYAEVLGFDVERVNEWRHQKGLTFRIRINQHQFVNVHPAGSDLRPRGQCAIPGGLDLCVLVREPISEVGSRLERHRVAIGLGPVERSTASGEPSMSIYVRDPDGNLIEFMSTR
jgi:catechol 2,3-dioxygenase-like lactoylglutathione lyase family enzyme